MEELLRVIVPTIAHILDLMGIFIVVESAIRNFLAFLKAMAAHKEKLMMSFAESIVFALDFKLAGEVIKTVTIRNMDELYILGAIVALRVILTVVLQWEIKNGSQRRHLAKPIQMQRANNSTRTDYELSYSFML